MNIESFNALTDEEKTALLNGIDENTKALEDLTAERDSLRDELANTQQVLGTTKAELQETKKVNFTLARQTAVTKPENPEEIMYKMFGGKTT